ncbi:MAG TPA: phosphotransferase [Microlunatus sp.]
MANRDGTDVVLKPLPPGDSFTFDRVVDAVSLTGTLRARGYPVPRYDAVVTVGELTVTVQEVVDGTVPAELDLSTAQQLVRLMELQAEVDRSSSVWASELVARVRPAGGSGQEALEQSDNPDLRAIAEETWEVADATWETLRTTDVVHADLHGENVLVSRDGRIAAVVDWEGAKVGDWRWDLAMLAWFHNSPEHPVAADAAEFLRHSLESVADRSALAFLAAAAAQTRLATAVRWRGPDTLACDLDVTSRWLRPLWA